MAVMDLFLFVWPGMLAAPMIRIPKPVEGTSVASDLSRLLKFRSFHPHIDCVQSCSNYATMRFEPESLHAANNGLHVARSLLEPIKREFPWISYGDLWTLAGVAAIQVSTRSM